MADTFIISVGTSGCGTGFEYLRKSAGLFSAASPNGSIMHDGRDAVEVLALDIDATFAYRLNTPLVESVHGWPMGTFRPCTLPGPDLLERIMGGRHPGRFEHFNGEAVRALRGHGDGSGAVRSNGWLAVRSNRKAIARECRKRLERIVRRRRLLAQSLTEQVRVILVAGTFGGFGSGAQNELMHLIGAIADELHLDISFTRFLILPGTNPLPDPDAIFALTYGVLKEVAAHATAAHWQRALSTEGPTRVRSRFVRTVLCSDTGNAPGEPRVSSVENAAGMLAEMLRALTLTNLGSQLDALVVNFEAAALQATPTGEPRCANSIGVSLIRLDREPVARFTEATLTDALLSTSLMPVELEHIHRDVRGFFEKRHIVEGAGAHQLSDRVLDLGDGRGGTECDRFLQLYRRNLAGLTGGALLTAAAARIDTTARQQGGIEARLAKRADELGRTFIADMHARVAELSRERRSGCTAARQWLEEAAAVAEHMAFEAAKDTTAFDRRVTRHQRQIDSYQNRYAPELRRKSVAYHWINRRRIEGAAADYCHCLEDQQMARMQLAAHLSAIELLNRVREACQARLREVQIAIDAIGTIRDTARAEAARVAAHSPEHACPVGLPLVNGLFDLQLFYKSILPDRGVEQALDDIHARLIGDIDLLQLAADPTRLREKLLRALEPSFRERLNSLHVVDGLRRRFCDPTQLGAALLERVRESYERLQLRDSCDEENGVYLVRLLGVDTTRVGDLTALLARYDDLRGIPFQVVHIDDPERIIFLQFRSVFPVSDWALFERARAAYERLSRNLPFERFHVAVGDRFLPTPGEVLSDIAARVVALKAWVIERLQHDEVLGDWHLTFDGEPACRLGPKLEMLKNIDGYRCAVDVVSDFTCRYLEHGPDRVRERLMRLRAGQADPGQAVASLECRLATLIGDAAIVEMERELEWWRKNTVPAAMQRSVTAGNAGAMWNGPALDQNAELEP